MVFDSYTKYLDALTNSKGDFWMNKISDGDYKVESYLLANNK